MCVHPRSSTGNKETSPSIQPGESISLLVLITWDWVMGNFQEYGWLTFYCITEKPSPEQEWTLKTVSLSFSPFPYSFPSMILDYVFFFKKKYQFGRWPWASCNILSFANCNFRSFLSFVHFLSFWNFMRIRLPSRRGHFNLQTVATLPEAFPDPWVDDTKKFSIWILKISFIIAILLLFPGLLIFLPFYFEILAEAFHD